jgi:hypothetical protein
LAFRDQGSGFRLEGVRVLGCRVRDFGILGVTPVLGFLVV